MAARDERLASPAQSMWGYFHNDSEKGDAGQAGVENSDGFWVGVQALVMRPLSIYGHYFLSMWRWGRWKWSRRCGGSITPNTCRSSGRPFSKASSNRIRQRWSPLPKKISIKLALTPVIASIVRSTRCFFWLLGESHDESTQSNIAGYTAWWMCRR